MEKHTVIKSYWCRIYSEDTFVMLCGKFGYQESLASADGYSAPYFQSYFPSMKDFYFISNYCSSQLVLHPFRAINTKISLKLSVKYIYWRYTKMKWTPLKPPHTRRSVVYVPHAILHCFDETHRCELKIILPWKHCTFKE